MSADLKKIRGLKRRGLFALLDVLIIGVFVIAAATATLTLSAARRPGESARVLVKGELVAEYPLSENGEYVINNALTLVIERGECYVTGSVCPDRICERRRIYLAGDSLYCAPAGILIYIAGEPEFSGLV